MTILAPSQISNILDNRVIVRSPLQMAGDLDPTKAYIITDNLDWSGSGVSITVPPEGLYMQGDNQSIRSINVSDENFTLFTSPEGGSGNLFIKGITFRVTGANSRVYGLTDSNGTHAIEVEGVNYENCTSLGEITDYRQLLEVNTGRFGKTPELTLSGAMSGFRISTSITLFLDNITSLFKAGTDLVFSGRFLTDMRCDLPAIGAFMDFAPANFSSEELLQLNEVTITRQGVSNPNDTGILPNISNTDVQSLFKDSTGIPNTKKSLRASCTAEIPTVIDIITDPIGTFYPIAGTMLVSRQSHISMPVNGQYEILSGTSLYNLSGEIVISGVASDLIAIRVTKSTDGGITFPTVLSSISRSINNFSGPSDIANIPLNDDFELSKGDRVRLEVANVAGAADVTMEIGSFITIKEDS